MGILLFPLLRDYVILFRFPHTVLLFGALIRKTMLFDNIMAWRHPRRNPWEEVGYLRVWLSQDIQQDFWHIH